MSTAKKTTSTTAKAPSAPKMTTGTTDINKAMSSFVGNPAAAPAKVAPVAEKKDAQTETKTVEVKKIAPGVSGKNPNAPAAKTAPPATTKSNEKEVIKAMFAAMKQCSNEIDGLRDDIKTKINLLKSEHQIDTKVSRMVLALLLKENKKDFDDTQEKIDILYDMLT